MARLNLHGDPDAILGMVFPNPDLLDVTEGKPLSSNIGRFVKHALYDAGVRPSDVFIDYLLPSYPGRRGFASIEAQDGIEEYKKELKSHIKESKNLKVLLLFGPEVIEAFGIQGALKKVRGFVFDKKRIILIPTFNPRFLFTGGGEQEVTFMNDLQKAVNIAKNGFSRPKENFLFAPTVRDIEKFLKGFDEHTRCYVDIEAIGSLTERDRNQITMIGIGHEETKEVMVIPILVQGGARYFSPADEEYVRKIISKTLSTSPCVFHNSAYDINHLNYQGYGPVRLGGDTMLLQHALHPELPKSLDYVTSVYGNIPYWKATLKSAKHQLDIKNEELWLYNARDVLAMMQIEPELIRENKEQGTYKIYEEISLPLSNVTMEMTNNGLPVDVTKLLTWKAKLTKRNESILDSMSKLWKIHPAFNWASGQHLAWLFYGQPPKKLQEKKAEYAEYFAQGSKKKKTTKKFKALQEYIEVFRDTRPFNNLASLNIKRTNSSAVSTDVEMRVRIREAIIRRTEALINMKRKTADHEQEEIDLAAMRQVIDNLMEYSENIKLLSTYTKLHIEPDGCVHAGFRVAGTKTGRLSSHDPNMQNQPSEAKKIFVAPEGWKFIQFDFTNLELVVLAYFADIAHLINVFEQGLNVHDENTKLFLGIEPSDPNWKVWRRVMKVYVFGRSYGGGLKGMYRRMLTAIPGLQMTFKQFEELDKKYFDLMPEYKRWYYETLDTVKRTRTLHNAFGRIRIFLGKLDEIERQGLNFPIQSTASDIMAYGLIDLYKEYKRFKAKGLKMRLSLSVHDSVVMLAPEREILVVLKMFKRSMCKTRTIGSYDVSFKGDVSIGDDYQLKGVEELGLDETIKLYEKRKADKSHG